MATLPSVFVALAAELIDDEFAAFKRDFNIKKKTYDPLTGEYTVFDETIGAIPIDLKTAENIFTAVTAQDIYVVMRNIAPVPSDFDSSYSAVYDGVAYGIKEVQADPANAAYFARLNV